MFTQLTRLMPTSTSAMPAHPMLISAYVAFKRTALLLHHLDPANVTMAAQGVQQLAGQQAVARSFSAALKECVPAQWSQLRWQRSTATDSAAVNRIADPPSSCDRLALIYLHVQWPVSPGPSLQRLACLHLAKLKASGCGKHGF